MASYYPEPVAPEQQGAHDGLQMALQAAEVGDIAALQAGLAVPGVDMNGVLEGDRTRPDTVLQRALRAGQVEAVQWLLAAGASVNAGGLDAFARQRMVWSREPFMVPVHPLAIAACAPAHADGLTALLLAAGATVDEAVGDGGAALHFAAAAGLLPVVTQLLAAGASPTMLNLGRGYTPLHSAIAGAGQPGKPQTLTNVPARIGIMKALLVAGADIDAFDKDGRTPLALLGAGGDPGPPLLQLGQALLAAGAQVGAHHPEWRNTAKVFWAAAGVQGEALALLGVGPLLPPPSNSGKSPVGTEAGIPPSCSLVQAVLLGGSAGALQQAVDAGARCDSETHDGSSVLWRVVQPPGGAGEGIPLSVAPLRQVPILLGAPVPPSAQQVSSAFHSAWTQASPVGTLALLNAASAGIGTWVPPSSLELSLLPLPVCPTMEGRRLTTPQTWATGASRVLALAACVPGARYILEHLGMPDTSCAALLCVALSPGDAFPPMAAFSSVGEGAGAGEVSGGHTGLTTGTQAAKALHDCMSGSYADSVLGEREQQLLQIAVDALSLALVRQNANSGSVWALQYVNPAIWEQWGFTSLGGGDEAPLVRPDLSWRLRATLVRHRHQHRWQQAASGAASAPKGHGQ